VSWCGGVVTVSLSRTSPVSGSSTGGRSRSRRTCSSRVLTPRRGCVAITLAAELPGATLTATDLSEKALSVASANVERHRLADRVELVNGSWCEPLRGRDFDIVVANPPYIPTAELAGLARDVREHEPLLALDGGPDGLSAYRMLLPSIATVLVPGGWAALEIDIRAVAVVEALGRDALGEATRTGVCDDLTGRPRVVTFERSDAERRSQT